MATKPQKFNVGDKVKHLDNVYTITMAGYMYRCGSEGWEYLLEGLRAPIMEDELTPVDDEHPEKGGNATREKHFKKRKPKH